jgi:putative endonuclease
MTPRHHQRLGSRGEALAAAWYTAAGYEVVARNWRCRDGELDLVVRRGGRQGGRQGDELVFCEVKTRTSDRFGVPAEAITEAKQQRMRVLAARFLAELGLHGRVRFDVACVVAGRIQVIEAAF